MVPRPGCSRVNIEGRFPVRFGALLPRSGAVLPRVRNALTMFVVIVLRVAATNNNSQPGSVGRVPSRKSRTRSNRRV